MGSIVIPDNVETIHSQAFQYCSSLTTVTVYAQSCVLGKDAFDGCSALKQIYVFADCVDTYKSAENWNAYADKIEAMTMTVLEGAEDGYWSTLCLPFSMDADEIAVSMLADCTIKELDNSKEGTSLSNEGVLTLKFKDAMSIEAGLPYIVIMNSSDATVTPIFSKAPSVSEPTAVTSSDGRVKFVGQLSPFIIDENNRNEILFLSDGNKIGYAAEDATLPRQLRNFRAHFWVQPDESGKAAARTIRIDFGNGETTGIKEVRDVREAKDDSWYSLDGRRLSGMPMTKGIYINNGRSVIIK